jgi:LysM repeat protein
MEFTILSDVVLGVGPLSGGNNLLTGPITSSPKPSGVNVGKRKYVVQKGDTLHSLSSKFYGSSKYWRWLGDFNNVTHALNGATLKY